MMNQTITEEERWELATGEIERILRKYFRSPNKRIQFLANILGSEIVSRPFADQAVQLGVAVAGITEVLQIAAVIEGSEEEKRIADERGLLAEISPASGSTH